MTTEKVNLRWNFNSIVAINIVGKVLSCCKFNFECELTECLLFLVSVVMLLIAQLLGHSCNVLLHDDCRLW